MADSWRAQFFPEDFVGVEQAHHEDDTFSIKAKAPPQVRGHLSALLLVWRKAPFNWPCSLRFYDVRVDQLDHELRL